MARGRLPAEDLVLRPGSDDDAREPGPSGTADLHDLLLLPGEAARAGPRRSRTAAAPVPSPSVELRSPS